MFESTEGFLENTFRKPPGKLHHLGEVPFDPGLICFVWFCFPFSFFSRESGQEDRLWTLGFVSLLFAGVTSGFGNLVASSTTEHYERTFREANFLNVWVYGFCSIAFFVLIPPIIYLSSR